MSEVMSFDVLIPQQLLHKTLSWGSDTPLMPEVLEILQSSRDELSGMEVSTRASTFEKCQT